MQIDGTSNSLKHILSMVKVGGMQIDGTSNLLKLSLQRTPLAIRELCGVSWQNFFLPALPEPNRIAAAFVSPTACSIYSIGNSVSWAFEPHIRLPKLLPHA